MKKQLLKLVSRRTFGNPDAGNPTPDNVAVLMDRAHWALEHPKQYTKIYTDELFKSVLNIWNCVNNVVKTIPEITANEKKTAKRRK